jgi:hypothetical protein
LFPNLNPTKAPEEIVPDEQTITQASQDTKNQEKAVKTGVQKKQTRKVIVVS